MGQSVEPAKLNFRSITPQGDGNLNSEPVNAHSSNSKLSLHYPARGRKPWSFSVLCVQTQYLSLHYPARGRKHLVVEPQTVAYGERFRSITPQGDGNFRD